MLQKLETPYLNLIETLQRSLLANRLISRQRFQEIGVEEPRDSDDGVDRILDELRLP